MKYAAAVVVYALFVWSQGAPPAPPPKQDPPAPAKVATDKEADEAIAAFKKEWSGTDLVSVRTTAITKLAETRHEKIAKTLAPYLGHPEENLAGTAALAMAKQDCAPCAAALAGALEASIKRPVVAVAILRSLGQLQYESTTPVLHKLTTRTGDDNAVKIMGDVFTCLGQIGSASSVDPLIDFLQKTERTGGPGGKGGKGMGAPGNQELMQLRGPCRGALRTITGLDGDDANAWRKAWNEGKKDLTANAKVTWINKETWERTTIPVGQKPPADKGEHGYVNAKLVEGAAPSQTPPPGKRGG